MPTLVGVPAADACFSGHLGDVTVWSRDNFMPYLGDRFCRNTGHSVTDTIRNAVAHISPNMDLRVADYAADIQACRAITPVLRYVARDLIHEELASLSGADPSASSPAASVLSPSV